MKGQASFEEGINQPFPIVRERLLENAVSDLQRSNATQDSYNGWVLLGKALARLRRFGEARSALERAYDRTRFARTSAIDKEIHSVTNWLGYVSFARMDGDTLLRYVEEALDKSGGFFHDPPNFETKSFHGRWVRARHMVMANHGLAVIGDTKAAAERDRFAQIYLDSKVLDLIDVDLIMVNNPPTQ